MVTTFQSNSEMGHVCMGLHHLTWNDPFSSLERKLCMLVPPAKDVQPLKDVLENREL